MAGGHKHTRDTATDQESGDDTRRGVGIEAGVNRTAIREPKTERTQGQAYFTGVFEKRGPNKPHFATVWTALWTLLP